jgi:hydrogenase-4 transcriptional activator
MERFGDLLLQVWREVCRHLRIEESVERIAPLLGSWAPTDLILVRQFDLQKSTVESLASGRCRGGEPPSHATAKSELRREHMERILAWSRSRELLKGSAREIEKKLPGILPKSFGGHVLAGPLVPENGFAGVLILYTFGNTKFHSNHEELLLALLEPLAVALENDHRLRELSSLREAVEAENRSLLSRLGKYDITDSIIGAETGLKSVMEHIELVARSDAPVLVLGETGSGKEVVARAVHKRSRQASGPFLRANCGAIPSELVDSELFGHERGSFTGAIGERKGWFERADGGTLFLDEIGELPLAAQVRLLRVLQDGSLERVGGERQIHVEVRVIAATHRDLQAMVADGRFRDDLWYRIAVFPIRLPALRDRSEDIPALASHFALSAAKRLGIAPVLPSVSEVRLLREYPWPGNVRELAAVIERAAILGGGARLEVSRALGAVPAAQADSTTIETPGEQVRSPSTDRFDTLNAAMTRHIEAALGRCGGRIEGPYGAAKLLSINPHTLRSRMRKLGVAWQSYRERGA